MLFYAAAGIWLVVYIVWFGWFVVRGTMETFAARARATIVYFITYAATVAICAFLVVPIALRFLPWWVVGLAELLVLLSGLGRLGQVGIMIATAEFVGPNAYFAEDAPVSSGSSIASESRNVPSTPPPWPHADADDGDIEPLDELLGQIREGTTTLGSLTVDEADELWEYLIDQIGLIDPWLGNRLAQLTQLEEVSDQGFILWTQYTVAKDELEQVSARAIMQRVVRNELGRGYPILLRSDAGHQHQDVPRDSTDERRSGSMPQITIDEVRDRWSRIRQSVRASSRRIEALLASADPLQIDGETLTLVAAYDFHRDGLNKDDTRTVIAGVVAQVLGHAYRIRRVNQEEARALRGQAVDERSDDDDGWGESLAYAEGPGDTRPHAPAGEGAWAEWPRDFADGDAPNYGDGEDEDDFPPLEVYNDERTRELREILRVDLEEHDRLCAQGGLRERAARATWLRDHPEVAEYLEWYSSEHGEQARKEARGKPEVVLEHYLFWTWV